MTGEPHGRRPEESHPYARLLALPETLVGEIIDGELHTRPRPAGLHASASSVLGMDIGSAFHSGRGGPGGWWIIDEPEVHFIRDTEVLVPDLAGWRRERMPSLPQDHRFEVVPDWVCEVLSPGTAKKDCVLKMKVYASHGVACLWLVDPLGQNPGGLRPDRRAMDRDRTVSGRGGSPRRAL